MNTLSKIIASCVEGPVAYRHSKLSFLPLHRIIERVLQGADLMRGQFLWIRKLDVREFDYTQGQDIFLSFKTSSPTVGQWIGVDVSPRVRRFGVRLTAVFHIMPMLTMSGAHLHLPYIPS